MPEPSTPSNPTLSDVIDANVVPFVLDDPAKQPRRYFELMTPSECRDFVVPRDHILVGDFHFTRGSITILAGVPGCGKSRLSNALAVAGATGADWMGLPVHSQFRTQWSLNNLLNQFFTC